MHRVGEAVQEADRGRLYVLGGEPGGDAVDIALVQRHEHLAFGVDALADGKAQAARHQRRRQVDIDVVLLEAVFVPDLDGVPEALGRDERGLGAFALDQRIGGEGGAVDDERDLRRHDARCGEHRLHRLEHATLRSGGCRQDLRRPTPAAGFERDVREGAADIDAEPRATAGFAQSVLAGAEAALAATPRHGQEACQRRQRLAATPSPWLSAISAARRGRATVRLFLIAKTARPHRYGLYASSVGGRATAAANIKITKRTQF